MSVLINIDVPDLEKGLAFYGEAFGLTVRRRLGEAGVELAGWPAPVFLLRKEAGSIGAGGQRRTYERHWTPVHLDVVVDEIEEAVGRALAAGAGLEQEVRTDVWGKIAMLADPFGHGLCLIQFLNRGYDEIAEPSRMRASRSRSLLRPRKRRCSAPWKRCQDQTQSLGRAPALSVSAIGRAR